MTIKLNASDIIAWLPNKLAEISGVEPSAIDITAPFATQGLDSLKLVALASELSVWIGSPVNPVELFDHPTIVSLARHLANEVDQSNALIGASIRSNGPIREPVSVIGMACRFPGCGSLAEFRDLLFSGRSAISPLPKGRWPSSATEVEGGFLPDVDMFDPLFFGITPREADAMDPQQRLLLMTVWHALEDAGIPPDSLAGTQTGVFVGISTHDYADAQIAQGVKMDAYAGTGNALSIAANRISYLLDLHGPSYAIDTACSSSLAAIHQARMSLQSGECDLAIVGGVNLMLHPDITEVFEQAGMMAADFRCKTFDASADGYVRAEGCGVVVLCRKSDADQRGLRAYAALLGSATVQDGRSNGLTAPNGLAQQAVIRRALASAGVHPSLVEYIETHGTGTALGDPIEVAALRAVFDQGEAPWPLWLGAVKTQIGHLEAAAGIAGLIKTCLVVSSGEIPANLNFQALNPSIDLEGSRVRLPVEVGRWQHSGVRYAGVSANGFGGCNVHVVLRSVVPPATMSSSTLPNLLMLSAHDERALQALARKLVLDWEASLPTESLLAELCVASQAQRTLLPSRFAILCHDPQQAQDALVAYVEGTGHPDLIAEESDRASPHAPRALLFTGMGASHVLMGRGLYEQAPAFRVALDRVDAALSPYIERRVRDLFATEKEETEVWLRQPHLAQPALFALEYALAHVWMAVLGKPDVVAGHSFGEYVAACIAGLWTVEDTARVVSTRAQLIESLALPGGMAAVRAAPEVLEHLISALPDHNLSLAAVNSAGNITVSGAMDSLKEWIRDVEALGGRVTWSEEGYAYHSTLLLPMVDEFSAMLEEIRYQTPKIPLINHFTGKIAGEEIREPVYWLHHLLEPVYFNDGVKALSQLNVGVIIEVGPHPILLNHTRALLPDAIRLASGRREECGVSVLLGAIARAATAGLPVKMSGLQGDEASGKVPVRALPLYPFQLDRYWFHADRSAAATNRLRSGTVGAAPIHPLLGRRLAIAGTQNRHYRHCLGRNDHTYIAHHCVFDIPVLPATAMVEWMLAAARDAAPSHAGAWELMDIVFERAMGFAEREYFSTETLVEPDGSDRRIQGWSGNLEDVDDPNYKAIRHVTATVRPMVNKSDAFPRELSVAGLTAELPPRAVEGFYEALRQRGIDYGPSLRGVKGLWAGNGQVLAQIELPETALEGGSYFLHPGMLDACLHPLFALINAPLDGCALLPIRIGKLSVVRTLPERVWCHIILSEDRTEDCYHLDLMLYDMSAYPLLSMSNLVLAPVSRSTFQRAITGDSEPDFYRVQWVPYAPTPESKVASASSSRTGTWIVFCAGECEGAEWTTALGALGYEAIVVRPGDNFARLADTEFNIGPRADEDIEALFAVVKQERPQVRGLLLCGGKSAEECQPLIDSIYESTESAFSILRHFLAGYADQRPNVIVLSHRAFTIEQDDGEKRLFNKQGMLQSPLAGLTRAVITEYHTLKCVQVDLDTASAPPSASEILACAEQFVGVGQVAWRNDEWWVARMRNEPRDITSTVESVIRPDASYLVTGGLSGVGFEIAELLAQRGARHLVLMSLSPHPEMAERIAGMQNSGTDVTVMCANVADETAVNKAIADISQHRFPLRGVIHAAGVTDDAAFTQLEWTRFTKVLDAKIKGAWNLHRATEHLNLDIFVLFSSIASMVGSGGQANHTVANTFLDNLALYRRRRGLSGCSINWGVWSETGTVVRRNLMGRFTSAGIYGLSTAQGLRAFEYILSENPVQLGVFRIDWDTYSVAKQRVQPDALLSELITDQPKIESFEAGLPKIELLDSHEAKQAISGYLLDVVGRVLRFNGSRKSKVAPMFHQMRMSSLGIDSLMAVELRNHILKDFSVDIAIKHLVGASKAEDVIELFYHQLMLRQLTEGQTVAQDENMEIEEFTL
jgi:phthiocerol/phenolphthiocerol synthesis type-I polyketide synthase C